MKKIFLLPALCLIILLSCKKNDHTDQAQHQEDEIPTEIKEYLECLQFNTAGAKQVGDFFILENDIIIDKKTIIDKMAVQSGRNAQGEQYAVNTDGVLTIANAGNVFYFIDPSVNAMFDGADWANAIVQAANDWTAINNCSVIFTQVFAANQAEITFFADNSPNLQACAQNLGAGTFAAARFPISGNIGNFISINDNGPISDFNGKLTIARHELGHALGYRHSDMYDRIGGGSEGANGTGLCGQQIFGGNLLHGTPNRDLNSVMVSGTDGFTNTLFNANDVRASVLLYPENCCASNILSAYVTPLGIGGLKKIDITVDYPIAWHKIRFEIVNGAGTVLKTSVDYVANVSSFVYAPGYLAAGTYFLRARGINYRGDLVSVPGPQYAVYF